MRFERKDGKENSGTRQERLVADSKAHETCWNGVWVKWVKNVKIMKSALFENRKWLRRKWWRTIDKEERRLRENRKQAKRAWQQARLRIMELKRG